MNQSKKRFFVKELNYLAGIIFGSVFFAVGYSWFLLPYNMAPGGVVREDRAPAERPRPAPPGAERRAEPAPPPAPAAPVTCEDLPKALAGAFGDRSDCALIGRTLREALASAEAGTITRWINTRSQTSGTIKVSAPESRDGAVCRRAELAVTCAGETKRAEAALCLRQGTWVLVE